MVYTCVASLLTFDLYAEYVRFEVSLFLGSSTFRITAFKEMRKSPPNVISASCTCTRELSTFIFKNPLFRLNAAKNESHLVVRSGEQHSRRLPFVSRLRRVVLHLAARVVQRRVRQTRQKRDANRPPVNSSKQPAPLTWNVRPATANFPNHHKATQKHTLLRGTH